MGDGLPRLLLITLTCTLLWGCGIVENDGDSDESAADSTFFRATLNGEEGWSGDSDAAFSKQGKLDWLTVFADSMYEGQYYRERLSLSLPFEGRGVYPMVENEYRINNDYTRTSGVFFSTNDGDVALTRYRPVSDSSVNQLSIANYDSTTDVMTGTFRTTVVIVEEDQEPETGEPPRRRPDTLRFTDGEFRVKVRDLREQ
jgi:hypothetical protein